MCKLFSTLFSLLFTILIAADSRAEIIVDVDVSDLSSVTFTTTDGFAEGTFDGLAGNGVTLADFFVGNSTTVRGQEIGSTLSVFNANDGSTRETLDRIWIANFGGGFTPNDVSFYDFGNAPIYSFDDQRALTGSAVFDLSTFTGLPNVGTVGNVYFDTPDNNQVIGQWRVVGVPEPTSGIVLAIGSMFFLRRRR